MRAALLTLSISRHAGGLLDCVRALAGKLQTEQGVAIEVLGLEDPYSAADLPGWQGLSVQVFPRQFRFAATGMEAGLQASDAALAHTHGLWSYCSPVVHRWSRRTGQPYLVSPQGMLDRWALQNSRWKKRVAAALFERNHLRDAACLHAVSGQEVDAIRAYGLSNPVCVVPNAVNLPPDEPASSLNNGDKPTRTLLFLGRLHPKKGLPNLLRAWANTKVQDRASATPWRLRIAGWDQGGHEQDLRTLVATLGLQDSIEFAGPVYGEAKTAALRSADAFVLPSHSEGQPLSVLEAWSYRLPVLMTPECNLTEGFTADAALRANPEMHSLATALNSLFQASDADRRSMGDRGRALVEKRFAWSQSARDMADVYRWLVGDVPRPKVVSD